MASVLRSIKTSLAGHRAVSRALCWRPLSGSQSTPSLSTSMLWTYWKLSQSPSRCSSQDGKALDRQFWCSYFYWELFLPDGCGERQWGSRGDPGQNSNIERMAVTFAVIFYISSIVFSLSWKIPNIFSYFWPGCLTVTDSQHYHAIWELWGRSCQPRPWYQSPSPPASRRGLPRCCWARPPGLSPLASCRPQSGQPRAQKGGEGGHRESSATLSSDEGIKQKYTTLLCLSDSVLVSTQ